MSQQEAMAYLADNPVEGEPTDDDISKAKKSIVDKNIPLHLSLFHTLFNLANIALLIGFTPHLGRLVEQGIVSQRARMAKHPNRESGSFTLRGIRRATQDRGA